MTDLRLDVLWPRLIAIADEMATTLFRTAFSARERRLTAFTVYDRAELSPDMVIRGPAIVEEASATTVMDAGGLLKVDRYGSLLIKIGGAP